METSKIAGFASRYGTSAVKMSTYLNNATPQDKFQALFSTNTKYSHSTESDSNTKTQDMNEETDNVAETAYGKYQYKDNSIQTSNTNQITVTSEFASKVKDALNEYKNDVKAVLKDKLGVSDEQIEQAMSTLGLQIQDLSDPQKLTSLVATLTKTTDNMSLVMSDSYQQIMQSVTELTKSMLSKLGLTVDQLQNVCNQINTQATVDSSEVKNTSGTSAANGTDTTTANENVTTATTQDDTTSVTNQTAVNLNASQQQTVSKSTQTDAKDANQSNVQSETTTTKQNAENIVTDSPEKDGAKSGSENENQPQNMNQQANADLEMKAELTETKSTSQDLIGGKEKEMQSNDKTVVAANQTLLADNKSQANGVTQANLEQAVQSQTTSVDIQNVIDQISEYSRVLATEDTTTLQMQLNPENLGKIYIEVTHKAGSIAATIAATNDSVKEALQVQVANLKEALNQQGIKVDAVEVTIASHEFERNLEQNNSQNQQTTENQQNLNSNQDNQQQQNQSSTRTLNMNYLNGENDASSEEELTIQMMKDSGNQMDITV